MTTTEMEAISDAAIERHKSLRAYLTHLLSRQDTELEAREQETKAVLDALDEKEFLGIPRWGITSIFSEVAERTRMTRPLRGLTFWDVDNTGWCDAVGEVRIQEEYGVENVSHCISNMTQSVKITFDMRQDTIHALAVEIERVIAELEGCNHFLGDSITLRKNWVDCIF